MFAFAFAGNTFYLYAATIPYVVGGVAGPTVQGLVSNRVSDSEQGNLQGVLASLVSLTAIFGPLIYTQLFTTYTAPDTGVYFPGAPYLLGGFILILATVVALLSLNSLLSEPNPEIIDDSREPETEME